MGDRKFKKADLASSVAFPQKQSLSVGEWRIGLAERIFSFLAQRYAVLSDEEKKAARKLYDSSPFRKAQSAIRKKRWQMTDKGKELTSVAQKKYRATGPTLAYVILEPGGLIKIGQTNNVRQRMVMLQCGNPNKLVLIATAPRPTGGDAEIHAKLNGYRSGDGGREWFEPTREAVDVLVGYGFDESQLLALYLGELALDRPGCASA